VFGTIFPLTGGDGSTGRPMRSSVDLAINDFKVNGNGILPEPGGTARRPLVAVHCDDHGESERALAAARHLPDVVGVPAIVGAAFSGITIDVATEVTIARGTLLLSPSATSAAITELADDGLVWRLSPSDTLQSKALVVLAARAETQLRKDLGLAASAP